MYLIKTPKYIQSGFPGFIWNMGHEEKVIYLTFDDGPVPEITPWVLDELAAFGAKASFFCVGENVKRYPDIFQRIIEEGHTVGNHTYHHLSGWKTALRPYLRDVRKCTEYVDSSLFRPPYGRLTLGQSKYLKRHFKIVMWDVISGDFDPKISAEQCYSNVVQSAGNGSIIVFHDSVKAMDKVKSVLPRVLEYYSDKGFSFNNLSVKEKVKASLS